MRQAKRCFALGTRLRGCDRYLVLQRYQGLCKTPFPSLLRRQEPSLKRSFSCRAGSRHQNMRNQIFDFIERLSFSEKCETSKALLCAGHPPTRVRQIFGFAKAEAFAKHPFPSLLRRQEPSLKRSFSCRAGSHYQNMRNQILDFIGCLSFSEKCKPSKALLCAGHPPTRVRQISGFAKVSS